MIKNKPKLVKRPIRRGQPISNEGMADTLMAMITALENLDVKGGKVVWKNGRPRIEMD